MADIKKGVGPPGAAETRSLDRPAPAGTQNTSRVPAQELPAPLPPRVRSDGRDRGAGGGAEAELLAEGRIGDESVDALALSRMGTRIAARHIMTLLAKKRSGKARGQVLEEVGALLLGLESSDQLRRIVLDLVDAGRIVDVYPLEVLEHVRIRRPEAFLGIEAGTLILNKAEIEAHVFGSGEVLRLKLPLAAKLRAFALEGGGAPGYCFSPGPPGEYHLELDGAGTFHVLIRGDIRRKSLIDRVVVRLEDRPGGGSGW